MEKKTSTLEKLKDRMGANIPGVVVANRESSGWDRRIILRPSPAQSRKLRRGNMAVVIHEGQYYQILPDDTVSVKVGGRSFKVSPRAAAKLQKQLAK